MAPSASRTFVWFLLDNEGASMGPREIEELLKDDITASSSPPYVC
jgi:hypothetical protein